MHQTVWIARHGHRLDFVNPQWFLTAERRYDPPLSEDGLKQAFELGERLKAMDIAHIFASPFLRTIQTANCVAEALDLSIKIEAGLSEWLNCEWMKEAPQTHPQELLVSEYPRIDWSYQSLIIPKYPETQDIVYQRTKETVQLLVERFSGDILLIGHAESVFAATAGLVGGKPWINRSLCCLVQVVRHGDKWKLKLRGDTSHLTVTGDWQTKLKSKAKNFFYRCL